MRHMIDQHELDRIERIPEAERTFGDRLQAARLSRGYTVRRAMIELSLMGIDIDNSTLARWEKGLTQEDRCPTLTVAALAHLYQVDLIDLSVHHESERRRMLDILAHNAYERCSTCTNGLKARCSAIELATLHEVTDLESDRAA